MAEELSYEDRSKELAVWALGSVATLLLAVAGFVGLNYAEVVLWATFFAGVCYASAFYVSRYNRNPRKTTLTVAGVSLLSIATIAAQIWLINRPKRPASSPVQQVYTGSATTNAAASPAVTGNGNSINVVIDNSDTMAKRSKKK